MPCVCIALELIMLSCRASFILSRCRSAPSRLLIMEEALRAGQPGPGTYSKTGDMGHDHRRKGSQPTPLSLDQSL